MWYAFLADMVVVVHLSYVAFVVLGQLVIVAGAVLRCGWVRNLWFRLTHLAAIVVVALEAMFGVICPLTTWEYELRVLAEQPAHEGSFVGRWAHAVLFIDSPPEMLTRYYISFALLVAGTLVLVPPRRRNRLAAARPPEQT